MGWLEKRGRSQARLRGRKGEILVVEFRKSWNSKVRISWVGRTGSESFDTTEDGKNSGDEFSRES